MRIGVMLNTDDARSVDDVVEDARKVEQAGLDAVWVSQIFGYDALGLLGILGREVPRLGLGTAVVPIQPRHPIVMASQALTVQAASGGRLTLGIGLSHQVVIEGVFGLSFDRVVRRMREYLEVLVPLLAGEQVSFEGETVRARTLGPLALRALAPPVVLAALGPRMLELAGRAAAGTVTWMTGPKTVADHIVPTIRRAAREADRPAPRVVVGLPTSVTNDPDGARARVARAFAIYGSLPSYRAMLDREGVAGPSEIAVVGDEAQLRRTIEGLEEAGATDYLASIVGDALERERTLEVLASMRS
jgi:5,10-methylenetetrahydromethanopterin reductase